jgi:methylthioribulose-1-phosphate dehydratase
MKNTDIYVLSLSAQEQTFKHRTYLRSPPRYKPSQCTPLFLAAFTRRGAGCCIHTHSHWAVLVTLLLEASAAGSDSMVFEINNIEQIKGFPKGPGKAGNLGYHDTLRIPIIENTPHEEDLTEYLEEAMERYPDTYAVLVRRHGVYVWGDDVRKAKTQCERYVYPFVHERQLPLGGCMLMNASSLRQQPRLLVPVGRRDEEVGHPLGQ